MVSVVIPARNERFLQNTIDDLLAKSQGEVEIIAVLDGYWPDPALRDDPRLKIIHRGEAKGMRDAINSAVAVSNGEFILKADAHTMWDEGWDVKLVADCEADWVVVPRRKRLDAENWRIQELGKVDIDYHYLSYPSDPNDYGGKGLNGKPWDERNKRTDEYPEIDDLMSAQGSAWFMKKDYFYELELMDEASYGKFWNEFQEIGLKAWLSGGRVVVNKKTWYAHLHKGKKYGRGYTLNENWLQQGREYTLKWMKMGKAWHKQKYPIEWLVQKFAPVPGWPQEIQVASGPTYLTDFKREKLVKLFRDEGFTKGAEIGVSGGRFTHHLCKLIPGLSMVCVDPYETYRGYKWGGRQERHDNHYNEFFERNAGFDVKLLKMTSMDGLHHVPDGSLDFVYIDGNHDFDHCMQDIIEWSKKVKRGGIVSGHDYYDFKYAGVKLAVDTYVKAHNISEYFVGDEGEPSWYWIKR